MISLNSIITTLALRNISYYCGSFLGNDIYYLKEFVDIVINIVGEDKLIQMLINDISNNKKRTNKLGKEWYGVNGMKIKLKKFDKIIEKTKVSYDLLEDATLNKKGVDYEDFSEKAKKIPSIKEDFYTLFVFLVSSTSIKKYSLKPEDIKVMENKGYKNITLNNNERLEYGNKTEEQ